MLFLHSLTASEMFNILLFLLGFVTVETSRKHLLCNTPKLEVFYEMCDDSFEPVVKMEPCELNKAVNFSITMIPRKNIDHLYSIVEIWKESVTVSQKRHVMCSEENDEYDFCGTLKGETLNAYYHGFSSRKLQLLKMAAFIPAIYNQSQTVFSDEKFDVLAQNVYLFINSSACFLLNSKTSYP
ncbi:lymphocyte antigen 96 isoform X1 [Bufo bufo]|uniref:lymphocyte antigen 96 isoform X1 n=1 Tax=Bufo bufo TaxID=8384 RepID=UPI001ABE6DAF|nr:lymphocyte antigen 96 isoform X1 [Bufo bufo]